MLVPQSNEEWQTKSGKLRNKNGKVHIQIDTRTDLADSQNDAVIKPFLGPLNWALQSSTSCPRLLAQVSDNQRSKDTKSRDDEDRAQQLPRKGKPKFLLKENTGRTKSVEPRAGW